MNNYIEIKAYFNTPNFNETEVKTLIKQIGRLNVNINFNSSNSKNDWYSIKNKDTNEIIISFLISFNFIGWPSREDNSTFINTKPTIGDITNGEKNNFNRSTICNSISNIEFNIDETNFNKRKTLSNAFIVSNEINSMTKIEEGKKSSFKITNTSSHCFDELMEKKKSIEVNINSFDNEENEELGKISSHDNYYQTKSSYKLNLEKIYEKHKLLKEQKSKYQAYKEQLKNNHESKNHK